MLGFLHNILGFSMLIWYSAIRWTWFDKVKHKYDTGLIPREEYWCWWAYMPMNMITAFSSILFILYHKIPCFLNDSAVFQKTPHSKSRAFGILFNI